VADLCELAIRQVYRVNQPFLGWLSGGYEFPLFAESTHAIGRL
jgi:hypothetical protein